MDKIKEKFCSRCGYDLTGLDFEGRCPECGGYFSQWSGEGLKDFGPMAKHRRGENVVRIVQIVVLVFLAVGLIGFGSLYYMWYGEYKPLFFTSVVALIFLVFAGVTALSLLKK